VCGKCWKGLNLDARWHKEARPCDSCGGPVINQARRHELSITACSPYCHKRIENARYRAKRSQHRTERPCATCGEPFIPERSDRLYCSPKCKQRAYRQRADHDESQKLKKLQRKRPELYDLVIERRLGLNAALAAMKVRARRKAA
jgi:hypothetical protein